MLDPIEIRPSGFGAQLVDRLAVIWTLVLMDGCFDSLAVETCDLAVGGLAIDGCTCLVTGSIAICVRAGIGAFKQAPSLWVCLLGWCGTGTSCDALQGFIASCMEIIENRAALLASVATV